MAVSSYKNCLHFDLVIHSLSVIHYHCQHPLRRCVSAGPVRSLHQKRVNVSRSSMYLPGCRSRCFSDPSFTIVCSFTDLAWTAGGRALWPSLIGTCIRTDLGLWYQFIWSELGTPGPSSITVKNCSFTFIYLLGTLLVPGSLHVLDLHQKLGYSFTYLMSVLVHGDWH